MQSSKRLWRESASLLIAGRNGPQEVDKANFKILVMKRSNDSSFMPSATVFPGGAFETSDENQNWLDYYRSFGIHNSKFDELLNVNKPRPEIFQSRNRNAIPKEISLRICAIRETFEEVGLLICRKPDHCGKHDLFSENISHFDVLQWQKKVHNNPKEFLELCKSLKVIPDLWSLYEWSAWLTPTLLPKRFETAFFLVALNSQPQILTEETEVQDSSWQSVDNLIKLFKNDKISISGPQIYELARLHDVCNIDELVQFAKKRNNKGVELIFPINYMTTDAFVSVLPGDDFYPNEPDFENEQNDSQLYMKETCDQFRKRAKNLHRTEYSGRYGRIISNIKPANDHLPVSQMSFSKL